MYIPTAANLPISSQAKLLPRLCEFLETSNSARLAGKSSLLLPS